MPALRTRKVRSLSVPKHEEDRSSKGNESDSEASLATSSAAADEAESIADSDIESTTSSAKPKKGRKKRERTSSFTQIKCQKADYSCRSFVREDHGLQLFGCAFNNYVADPQVFATVGGNRVTLYQCQEDESLQLLQAYADPNEDESFYCCTWLCNPVTKGSYLAAAGYRGIIRVISPKQRDCIKSFTGHGHSINALRTHPLDGNLLASASKDHTLRLWNTDSGQLIAIFGGCDGHKDEVLSVDIDPSGSRMVSGGMDHFVKVWRLDGLQDLIQLSYNYSAKQEKRPFPTKLVNFPDFSTTDIHNNYVDCVRWFGHFIISKSCEEFISIWKPGEFDSLDFSKGETNVSLMLDFYFYHASVWFIRLGIDPGFTRVACGNQKGKIYVWNLRGPIKQDYSLLSHPKCNYCIRQVCFNLDASILIAIADDGTVWRWDLNKPARSSSAALEEPIND